MVGQRRGHYKITEILPWYSLTHRLGGATLECHGTLVHTTKSTQFQVPSQTWYSLVYMYLRPLRLCLREPLVRPLLSHTVVRSLPTSSSLTLAQEGRPSVRSMFARFDDTPRTSESREVIPQLSRGRCFNLIIGPKVHLRRGRVSNYSDFDSYYGPTHLTGHSPESSVWHQEPFETGRVHDYGVESHNTTEEVPVNIKWFPVDFSLQICTLTDSTLLRPGVPSRGPL